jgi:hypothetical protein
MNRDFNRTALEKPYAREMTELERQLKQIEFQFQKQPKETQSEGDREPPSHH